jgi:hypothetical protein
MGRPLEGQLNNKAQEGEQEGLGVGGYNASVTLMDLPSGTDQKISLLFFCLHASVTLMD